MAPEYAKVYLVEDEDTFRKFARRKIEEAAHKIVVDVSTFKDALNAIPNAKESGVNVAVVDGNLTENDTSGYDGERIAAALREAIPGIKIVSFSGNEQPYGDAHVSKGKFDQVNNLGNLITSL